MKNKNFLSDFVSLFYPELCAACGNNLYKGEDVICTYCKVNFPYTNFHLQEDNPLIRLFWGRVEIDAASAFVYFRKNSKVQHLLHQLKYKGRTEVGTKMGLLYGNQLIESKIFSDSDLIIPVPLHPKKELKRGFNQSDFFANGLSESMNKPAYCKILVRTKNTETQTKKSRYGRFQNVDRLFEVINLELIKEKNILLVDDVLTTGSTLESCAAALLEAGAKKINVATIACGQ